MKTDRELRAWIAGVTDSELALFFLVTNALSDQIGLRRDLDERSLEVRKNLALMRAIRPSIERLRELRALLKSPDAVLQAAISEARGVASRPTRQKLDDKREI